MSSSSPSALSQVRSVAAVLALSFTQGIALGWSSPGVSKLKGGEGPFRATLDEISWIVAFFSLGILAGSTAGAAVFGRTGRRSALLLVPTLMSLSAALTLLGSSARAVYAARLLAGAGHGVGISFNAIYVAEVSDAAMRGRLILVTNLMLMVGSLAAFVLGPVLPYRALAALPIVTSAAALWLRHAWMRESPYYLVSAGRPDEALKSLRTLRDGNKDEEVRSELAAIEKTVKQQQQGGTSLRAVFASPAARRAAVICLVASGSFAALGVPTLLAFTQLIVEEAGAPLSPAVCSVVLVLVNMAAVLASMPLVERVGRRPVLAGSAFGNAASMAALASYLLARDVLGAEAVSSTSWLPLASLMSFMAATGFGVVTLPHVLVGELLPQRTKASVAPAIGVVTSLTAFVLNKSFIPVGRALSFGVPFAFFAATNLAYGLFVVANVPETKGKTLAQVQEMLAASSTREQRGSDSRKDR